MSISSSHEIIRCLLTTPIPTAQKHLWRWPKYLLRSQLQIKRTADRYYSIQVRSPYIENFFIILISTLVGGPGASAIDLIRGAGQGFQAVLGEEYDVIGFDPRYIPIFFAR